MNNSVVATNVVKICMSAEAQRIKFTTGFVKVDGAGFAQVAAAVVTGEIAVDVGPMDPGDEATYTAKTKTLKFKSTGYGSTLDEKCTILHECVHALIDLQWGDGSGKVSTFLTQSEDEAAAYLAEGLYEVYVSGYIVPGEPGDIRYAVYKIIEKAASGHKTTRADIKTLRHTIAINYDNLTLHTPTFSRGRGKKVLIGNTVLMRF